MDKCKDNRANLTRLAHSYIDYTDIDYSDSYDNIDYSDD